MSKKRKSYNTTLRSDLTRGLRILAAQHGKRQNDLLEEAIQDLLIKYERAPQQAPSSSSLAKAERRDSPRAEVSWPVSMITPQGLFEGQIKDISRGGALIQCAELPKTDEPLELSIEIPDHLLGISATVEKVRLNIDDSEKDFPSYDLAVRFLGIDVDQRKHLYNAIEDKTRKSGI
ncbi:MAG: PilZ domain-containing protein [Deltaproteobacteria bacterium]|nr:PilZ domain-containing protein [Deltaproteobacteria bacterium]